MNYCRPVASNFSLVRSGVWLPPPTDATPLFITSFVITIVLNNKVQSTLLLVFSENGGSMLRASNEVV